MPDIFNKIIYDVLMDDAFKIASVTTVIAQKMLLDKGFIDEYMKEVDKFGFGIKTPKEDYVESLNNIYEDTKKLFLKI